MSDFGKAQEELGVIDTAAPSAKLRACCQWYLGDPSWADTFIDWAEQAGYEIREAEKDAS